MLKVILDSETVTSYIVCLTKAYSLISALKLLMLDFFLA